MNYADFPIKTCCNAIKTAHEKGEIAVAVDTEDTEAILVYYDEDSKKEKYSDICIFCNKKIELQLLKKEIK
jgi:hypothetical protein